MDEDAKDHAHHPGRGDIDAAQAAEIRTVLRKHGYRRVLAMRPLTAHELIQRRTEPPEAGTRERALDATREKVRKASEVELLATCRWILAEGTDLEAGAHGEMNAAEQELAAARDLHERVRSGKASAHELVGLLRGDRGIFRAKARG